MPDKTGTQDKLKTIITAAAGERDKTKKQLEQTKKILQNIFETTPDYIFTKDQKKRYTMVNPAMEILLQKPASQIKGKTDEHLFTEKLAKKTNETDDKTLKGKITREKYTETVSNIQTTLEIIKIPLRDKNGKTNALFGSARDLTEHNKTTNILQTLLDSTGDIAFILDTDQKYSGIYGLLDDKNKPLKENYIGRKIREVHGDESIIHEIHTEQALRGEETIYEWSTTDSLGPRDYQIHLKPMLNPQNEIIGVLGAGLDITEHKKTIKKLRKQEKKIFELTEMLPVMAFETDEQANIKYANHRLLNQTGYLEDKSIKGLNVTQLIKPEEKNQAEIDIKRTLRGEKVEDREYTIQRKNNTTFPALMHLNPIMKENKPAGIMGFIINLSNQKKTEKTIKEVEDRYNQIFETSPDAMVLLDNKGKFIKTNNRLHELIGYDKLEIIGVNLLNASFIPAQSKIRIMKNFSQRMLGKKTQPYEVDFITKSGVKKTGLINATALRDGAGKIIGDFAIISDTSDRKKSKQLLEKAYKTNKDIIEKAPFGIYLVNERGGIDYVNPQMIEIAGDTYEQFKNLNVFRLPTYEKIGLTQKIKDGLKGKYFELGSIKYTSYYGGKATVRNFTGIPLEGDKGPTVLVIVEDITEMKQAEDELRQQTEDLLLINSLSVSANIGEKTTEILRIFARETRKNFNCFGATIYLLSRDKKKLVLPRDHVYSAIDQRLVKAFGRKVGTKTMKELIIPLREGSIYHKIVEEAEPKIINNPDEIRVFVKELFNNRQIIEYMQAVYNTLGIKSLIIIPLFSGDDCIGLMEVTRKKRFSKSDLQRLSFIAENLTTVLNRKMAEEDLAASKAGFHNIVENSADGVMVLDEDNIVRYINPVVEMFFEKSREDFTGKSFGLSFKSGDSVEVGIRRENNRPGIGEMRVVKTRWEDEPAYLAVIRDITERKKMEETIKTQVKELEKLDKAKTEFISIAGHELRTPAQSMILATDILLGGSDLKPSEKKYLDIIKKESLRLKKLINDLLDLSALQLGKTDLYLDKISVDSLLADVGEEMRLEAEDKGVTLVYKAADNLVELSVDESKLKRVLLNLVNNSIKHTPAGGLVSVTVKSSANVVLFCVSDTGTGIPQDLQDKLFERFFQVNPMVDKDKGFGIGLSISKEIIEAHGGAIWCESKEGEGSSFYFTIPLGGKTDGEDNGSR